MYNDLVSVVVPVYNVDQYIRECLESIVTQTYKNIQIVIINDGSTDTSLSICEEYQNMDSRIEIITTVNSGLSSARNIGIEHSKADYLVFVDSDDFLDTTYIEKLLYKIKDTNADLVMCNFYSYQNGVTTFDGATRIFDEELSSHAFLKKVYTYPGFYVPAWNKIYKRKLFQNIKYPNRTINEDSQIIRELIMNSTTIICLSEPLYYYRKREGSILTQKSEILLIGELNWIKKDQVYYEEMKNVELFNLASKLISSKIIEFYPKLGKKMKKQMILEFRDNMKNIIRAKNIKTIVKIKLLLAYINMDFFELIFGLFKATKRRLKRSN